MHTVIFVLFWQEVNDNINLMCVYTAWTIFASYATWATSAETFRRQSFHKILAPKYKMNWIYSTDIHIHTRTHRHTSHIPRTFTIMLAAYDSVFDAQFDSVYYATQSIIKTNHNYTYYEKNCFLVFPAFFFFVIENVDKKSWYFEELSLCFE